MTRSSASAARFASASAAPRPTSRAEPLTFASQCPEDKVFKIEDLMSFRRGRGDLAMSVLALVFALAALATFWFYTGWVDRNLPDDLGTYLLRQLGLVEGEGRLTRVGRIVRQSWVAPLLCLMLMVPAAALNLRASIRAHRWRVRFRQPTAMRYELEQWARALEFVAWFITYTLLVPILGYLVATMLLGLALPFRLGYRSPRWIAIAALTSFCIVLLFRTGLQIKTPINIWLYNQMPTGLGSFMKTWF